MKNIFLIIFLFASVSFAKDFSLYPVNVFGESGDQIYVSFYYDDKTKSLESKFMGHVNKELIKDENKYSFILPKELRDDLISTLKAKKVFVKAVDDPKTYEHDLNDLELIVVLNAAGGPDFGSYGFALPKGVIKNKEAVAWIGDENPFIENSTLKQIEFASGTATINSRSSLIEKINPNNQKDKEQTGISDDRSYSLKQNGKTVVLVEKIVNGDYSYPPRFILTAPLFKDGSQFFYFDSMGMGNCGKFFKVKDAKIIDEKSPSCGAWGC